MVSCKVCGCENPLDSKFCKQCGIALSESEIAAAKEKLATIIEDGNLLFTEGRTDEAMMLADEAVQTDPSNAPAISLKGLCFEKLGQVAEAIECYETAVSLNPDNALDRVKLNALRNRLGAASSEVIQPKYNRAYVAAGSAALFVIVVGVYIGIVAQKSSPQVIDSQAANSSTVGFSNQTPHPDTLGTAGNTQSGATQQTNSTAPNVTQNSPNPLQKPIPWSPPTPDSNGSALPLPGGSSQTNPLDGKLGIIGDPPVTINTALNPDPNPVVGSGTQNSATLASSSQPSSGNSADTSATDAKNKPDDSVIDIQLGNAGQRKNQPGAQSITDNNGVKALQKVAVDQLQLGNFNGAASSFKKLIQFGGDSPNVEQNLGLCYSKLGSNDKAVNAYKIAATQYQLAASRGINVSANKAGLAVCVQEIKNLGGK